MTTKEPATALDLAKVVAEETVPTDSIGRMARMFARALIARSETPEGRGGRALEAMLAWARTARDSDRRGTELFEMRQAIARAPSISTSIEDLEAAGRVRRAAEVALHDACAREDRAEEKLREVARALLDEEESAPANVSAAPTKTFERDCAHCDYIHRWTNDADEGDTCPGCGTEASPICRIVSSAHL